MSPIDDKDIPRNNVVFDKIGVENFKAFGALQRVRLKPITLLYGKNSSGKSSFIHSLLYLKSTKSSGNFDPKDTKLLRFGGFDRFKHERFEGQIVAFELCVNGADLVPIFSSGLKSFNVRLEVKRNGDPKVGPVCLQQILFSISDEEPFFSFRYLRKGRYKLEVDPKSKSGLRLFSETEKNLETVDNSLECVVTENYLIPDRVITKSGTKPQGILVAKIEDFLTKVSKEISDYLDNVSYLCGNRDVADQGILDGAVSSNDEEDSGGLYYWEQIRKDAELREQVNTHLRLLFDKRYEIIAVDFFKSSTAAKYAENIQQDFTIASEEIENQENADNDLGGISEYLDHPMKDEKVSSTNSKEEKGPKEKPFGELVEDKLDSVSGDRIEIRILDTHSKTRIKLLPHELGFGVGQVIPIIAAACLPGRTVIVEQPETHLHPKQQADLGEILASSLALQEGGGEGSTFIIETHSIHILERLGKIIREASRGKDFKGLKLKTEEVGVYYISQQDSAVRIRTMELNSQGKLSRDWPDGFFNEDVGDLF